jgi:ribonuclease-3
MKTFTARVRVAGREYGEGTGRSKKEAEQRAAEAAWTRISDLASVAKAAAADSAVADPDGVG